MKTIKISKEEIIQIMNKIIVIGNIMKKIKKRNKVIKIFNKMRELEIKEKAQMVINFKLRLVL